MSCPKHKHLEKLLELEEYKDFKPYEGEEYYQKNKDWLWSKLHWDLYMDVAR
jgi:hypothetical protein